MWDFDDFERKAKERGLDRPVKPLAWFFITYVKKNGGAFTGPCLVEAENRIEAANIVFQTSISPESARASFEDSVEVPEAKLPAEQYRNRLLTLDEVREFWPWVKA